jgi:hypothetical protein
MARKYPWAHTGAVDIVEFRLDRESLGGRGPFRVINLFVNGTRLQDLVRSVEQPYAKADGNAGLAGNYAGLAVGPTLPASHYLGEPVETWFGDGDTILLGCVCGDPGCWPLTARVTVSESTVTWSGFRTGHRDWDLSAVGPFTFERRAYEAALVKAYPT